MQGRFIKKMNYYCSYLICKGRYIPGVLIYKGRHIPGISIYFNPSTKNIKVCYLHSFPQEIVFVNMTQSILNAMDIQ